MPAQKVLHTAVVAAAGEADILGRDPGHGLGPGGGGPAGQDHDPGLGLAGGIHDPGLGRVPAPGPNPALVLAARVALAPQSKGHPGPLRARRMITR